METEVLVVLISGGMALFGTYLGAYLNRRSAISTAREMVEIERFKYTQDRIWDFRKEAYTAILARLKEALVHSQKVSDGYHDEHHHPEAYHGSEARQKDDAAAWKAWADCKAEFENSRLTLSDEFVDEFASLVNALKHIDEDDLPPDIAWEEAKCFSSAYPKLLEIAKQEIAPSQPTNVNGF
ncbi:hypothetical protein [Ruegeria atlantica]|uniref:hypothetical protein n=1 Tax=Ruegeria atlantica TaxID=81569 RepID=UPI0014817E60|nr:hypothetical protein [Ruegeria atlantica]